MHNIVCALSKYVIGKKKFCLTKSIGIGIKNNEFRNIVEKKTSYCIPNIMFATLFYLTGPT